ANGRLLRAFTTEDGKWRLRTTAQDVDPAYPALLKDYEDRRFADHWGVDPFAVVRPAGLVIPPGHLDAGASTPSIQLPRLLRPPRRPVATACCSAGWSMA